MEVELGNLNIPQISKCSVFEKLEDSINQFDEVFQVLQKQNQLERN